ncbi:MAG: hypothetical protein DI555_07945 [Novosphingobium pentaromativorans]|uniref:HNH nuclease domain-containing protein n=1 Tax=Novosphingobium pentaromativorans TaxID=205844 RepID=A0A2W5NP12_9SPHN|nr:MAG: hypothetical protein DI555_07945 [Novosphingobium pentaromativorans]
MVEHLQALANTMRQHRMVDVKLSYDMPVCNADGCDRLTRSRNAGWCEKHYYQMRRNGHLGPKLLPVPRETLDHVGGYKLLYAPRHPISTSCQRTRVYQHRAVYYEHHGDGPFPCAHCGTEVSWSTMHVDHLDDDPTNNAIENLAAACPGCNQRRGVHKMVRTMRTTRSLQLTWRGETKSVCDWADEIGLSHTALKNRIKAGWPLDRAMTEPRGRFGPKGSNPPRRSAEAPGRP